MKGRGRMTSNILSITDGMQKEVRSLKAQRRSPHFTAKGKKLAEVKPFPQGYAVIKVTMKIPTQGF